MLLLICPDCEMFNDGYSKYEWFASDYSTEFPPLSLYSNEATQWLLTAIPCRLSTEGHHYCPGHFFTWPCQACGNPKSGKRFCYTALRIDTRVEA